MSTVERENLEDTQIPTRSSFGGNIFGDQNHTQQLLFSEDEAWPESFQVQLRMIWQGLNDIFQIAILKSKPDFPAIRYVRLDRLS